MAKREVEIKKGDTFLIVGTYTNSAGEPINLDQVEIKSQIRNLKKQIIADLVVIKENQDNPDTRGKYVMRSDTNTWPLGELNWDIQYTTFQAIGNYVQSTETLTIIVVDEVTL